jgi:hypothetical protein
MKEEISDNKREKKEWNLPLLFSLDVKKTEGGYPDQTENYASGTINTQPS